jgi:NADPH:quinone reductase-like Zn-dependent oxidoreductase
MIMRAVVVAEHGRPEVLKLIEVPDLAPRPGEALIRVKAAGINFADLFARQGLYPDAPKPPFTPGLEVSGEIAGVGPEVTGFQNGQRVIALVKSGGYAEKVAAPTSQIVPIPEGMDFPPAAALPVNYLTAYHMLFYMASVRRGERVLIHAAAGGVGLAAIQLCKIAGAEIYGTASESKFEFLRQRGVAHLVDYRTQDFEEEVRLLTRGEGVDIVLDAVGGGSFKKSYRLLRPAGRLVVFGFSAAMSGPGRSYLKAAANYLRSPRFNPLKMFGENRSVLGVHLGRLPTNIIRGEYESLFQFFAEGLVRPHVDKVFPLEQAAEAHRYIHERKNIGKVLLAP